MFQNVQHRFLSHNHKLLFFLIQDPHITNKKYLLLNLLFDVILKFKQFSVIPQMGR